MAEPPLRWSVVTSSDELERIGSGFGARCGASGPLFGSIGWAAAYIDTLLDDPLHVLVGEEGGRIAHLVLLREVDDRLQGLYAEKTDIAPVLLSDEVGWRRADLVRGALASTEHAPRLRVDAMHEREVAELFTTFDITQTWACPVTDLPGWQSRASAGLRHEVRRDRRRLERDVGPLRHRWLSLDGEAVTRTTDANRSWKIVRDDVPFARKDAHVAFLERLVVGLPAGRICEAQLHAGERLVSSLVCFVVAGWVGYFFGAHDIELARYGPGKVNLAITMDWLASAGMSEFDFLRGDEGYKYRYGAEDRYRVLSGEGVLRASP